MASSAILEDYPPYLYMKSREMPSLPRQLSPSKWTPWNTVYFFDAIVNCSEHFGVLL